MNQLPIMPIRVQYADETTKGVNIDSAIEGITGDVSELETTVGDADSGLVKDVSALKVTVGDSTAGLVKKVSDLEITVGDSSAGLVKQVGDLEQKTTGMSYSEGVTDFDGKVTGDEIVENMSGYSANLGTSDKFTITNVYHGAVKNGNKLTLVSAIKLTRTDTATSNLMISEFIIPNAIGNKLYPVPVTGSNYGLAFIPVKAMSGIVAGIEENCFVEKNSNTKIKFYLEDTTALNNLELNTEYYIRVEVTFLLSSNLIS